jgi:hypothetical protein
MLSKVFPRKYRIFELQEVNSINPCKTHVCKAIRDVHNKTDAVTTFRASFGQMPYQVLTYCGR